MLSSVDHWDLSQEMGLWRASVGQAAALSVLEQWKAGVQGVRPLAAAAEVSKTTVQDMYKRGLLPEPAKARSA